MDTTDSYIGRLKKQVEDLVKKGGDLRAETSRLVSEASVKAHEAAGGLEAMVKAVADGAVSGAKQTLPEDTDSVLKSVVEGVTDGLTKSAQAMKLALEESGANGTRFAKEDLSKLGQDFRGVGTSIGDIVKGAANAMGGHAKEQAKTLADHAKKTLEAAWPSLESAIKAAQHDPVKLGRETATAGVAAAREAAGVLFGELGQLFQKAGEKLRR